MAKNYDGMAVGVFELDNLVACFVALDAASKAANVTIQECGTKPTEKWSMCQNAWQCFRCKCCNGSSVGDS